MLWITIWIDFKSNGIFGTNSGILFQKDPRQLKSNIKIPEIKIIEKLSKINKNRNNPKMRNLLSHFSEKLRNYGSCKKIFEDFFEQQSTEPLC